MFHKQEAAITYSKMGPEEVVKYVTVEDFQYYWQRADERIQSSYSRLPFGHYKTAAFSEGPLMLYSAKLNLCAKIGVALGRWGIGLTIHLENNCGNNFVHKLWAICMYEADFNWWNKLIFARRMMDNARDAGIIPNECFAKRNSKCMDEIMTKTFFADIS